TSIDACMESKISFGEIGCALLVTGPGTNNKTNRTIPKVRPSAPKSNSSRRLAGSISISISLASSELGCSSDQRSSADSASPQTHAITMVTNASARKAQNIALSRRKSRGYPKLLSTSIRSASQSAEAQPEPQEYTRQPPPRYRWLGLVAGDRPDYFDGGSQASAPPRPGKEKRECDRPPCPPYSPAPQRTLKRCG